jgi:mannose/cellobiose epimerase-like protein (N-acyl-D-glucosamine 2-epimerase family)
MQRREFIGKTLAAGLGGAFALNAFGVSPGGGVGPGVLLPVSRKFLQELYGTCQAQLMKQYFPFWEKGGVDHENGGFMCYLYPDGSVENDRKDIWYQGRGIWVNAHCHNNFKNEVQGVGLLANARKARTFMVEHMHRGDGTWITTVDRTGQPVGSIAISRSNNIYGALFAAVGLIELAKATGSEEDLNLAKVSLRKSLERYEDPAYGGVSAPGVVEAGLRAQGHAFMLVWVIPQLLELQSDPWFEAILEEHLDALQNKFWNPDYGISNEVLFHDYSRIPSQAGFMVPGHSIEAQWMGMMAAGRKGDKALQEIFKNRMRRLIEMSWDYVFDGTCDTGYHAVATEKDPAGPVLDEKTMWAQTEVCIGCLLAYEHTGEQWALDWFKRSWDFLQRTMPTEHGVWRQAVDRQGHDKQREGISKYRQGNFHQPRCLMYLMESAQRMLKGKTA